MKKYYYITCNGKEDKEKVYPTNIAYASSVSDVEEYFIYHNGAIYVRECTPEEVEEAKRNGKFIIELLDEKCHYCGLPLTSVRRDENNNLICDFCAGITYCDVCGKEMLPEESHEIDGGFYCDSCAESEELISGIEFFGRLLMSDNNFKIETENALFNVFQIREGNLKYILVGESENRNSDSLLEMNTGIVGVLYNKKFYFDTSPKCYRQPPLRKFYSMIEKLYQKRTDIYSLTAKKKEFCDSLAEKVVPGLLDDFINKTSQTQTLTEDEKEYCKAHARATLIYTYYSPDFFDLKAETDEAITKGDFLNCLQGLKDETKICSEKIIADDYQIEVFLQAYARRKCYEEFLRNPLAVAEAWELKISDVLSDKPSENISVGFKFCGKESELSVTTNEFLSLLLYTSSTNIYPLSEGMNDDFVKLGENLGMSRKDHISIKNNLTYIKYNGKIIFTKGVL